ncbi:MAG: fibronectin type III domain-containing protein [Nocardioides sp.]|nr:fibronectin type III domain-containing protein [Nocardioides sp.]
MTRLRSLAATAAALLTLPLLATTPAAADPIPPEAQGWPWCGHDGDDDGRYCIVSASKDGVAMSVPDRNVDYDDFWVEFFSDGSISAIPYRGRHLPGELYMDYDVDPSITWSITLNTGPIRPDSLFGTAADASFSVAGSATTGWRVTTSFRAAPIAWNRDIPCSFDGGCGDETTVATLRRSFGQVVLTRGHYWPGWIGVTSAQDAYPYYDADTNTLEVRLANPHLAAPGEVATGSYSTFLPDAMLVNDLNVPDPTLLTSSSLRVTRRVGGTTTSTSYTVTRTAGGVWIRIPHITFSRPKYLIRPRPTAPGQPRIRSVSKTGRKAVVRFRRPVADGGATITRYVARCRKGTGTWKRARATRSPVVVTQLPRGRVTCQVRAVNKIGAGRWSKARRS